MNRMIISTDIGRIQVAITEDNMLEHYFTEKETEWNNYGDIYIGRVEQIKPGIHGAFVNIGQEKNALLHISDIIPNSNNLPINKIIKQGQEILVQIKKEAVGEKGARLTTKFSLTGHFIILLPTEEKVFISKKITDKTEIDRLKCAIINEKPDDLGVIIRTEAKGVEVDTLVRELNHLIKSWRNIKNIEKAPKLLYKEENIVFKTIRDYYSQQIDEIIIGDQEIFKDVNEYFNIYFPNDTSIIKYSSESDLFEKFKLYFQISELYKRKLWLKSGGHIVIDYTEAFTVIDVNSGKFTGHKNMNETILKINLEATEVIADQIRLRNISGIILIDYINIQKEKDQKKILNRWDELLKKDKVRTKVYGFTQLFILQITRKQQGKSLHQMNYEECRICEGSGLILNQEALFNECLRLIKDKEYLVKGKQVILKVSSLLKSLINEIEVNNKQYSFVQMMWDVHKVKVILEEDIFLKGTDMKLQQII